MQRLVFILIILLQVSCSERENKVTDNESKNLVTVENKVENALTFINSYTQNANKLKQSIGIVEWVNSSDLVTLKFKTELKKLMEDAYKQDPELGLGADPIFDAQDYPSKGFEIDSFDAESNYLTVKGIDWPAFKLTMKIVLENEKWLVDGCGIINIPIDKRVTR